MKHFLLLVLSGISILLSCSKEDSVEQEVLTYTLSDLEQYGYFPLHVGNEWEYLSDLKVRTDTEENLDGNQYFRFITSGIWSDTTHYRKDRNQIFEKRRGRAEILRYDLEADENKIWKFGEGSNSPYEFKATLINKNANVETETFDFENCYHFYYDIPELADDEHDLFLAKGIGLVKQIYWGGFPLDPGLSRVKIDGKEVIF